MDKYILKYRKPILCNDVIKWGKWFERAHRRVRLTILNKDLHISTVFLALDHSWCGELDLFETMVFRKGEGAECYRCTTWREALNQHWKTVGDIKNEYRKIPY